MLVVHPLYDDDSHHLLHLHLEFDYVKVFQQVLEWLAVGYLKRRAEIEVGEYLDKGMFQNDQLDVRMWLAILAQLQLSAGVAGSQ